MVFDWLFGAKSKDLNVQAAWKLASAKKLLVDAEEIISAAIIEYRKKLFVIMNSQALSTFDLMRLLRDLYHTDKTSFTRVKFEGAGN